jgi:hypothetical protein
MLTISLFRQKPKTEVRVTRGSAAKRVIMSSSDEDSVNPPSPSTLSSQPSAKAKGKQKAVAEEEQTPMPAKRRRSTRGPQEDAEYRQSPKCPTKGKGKGKADDSDNIPEDRVLTGPYLPLQSYWPTNHLIPFLS